MSRSEWTSQARRSDGSIDFRAFTRLLSITEAELAASVGLSGEGVRGESGQDPKEVQHRLNALVEPLERVTPWSGNPRTAFDWYCNQSIAGLGGKTAQELVKTGRISAVEAYLDRVADGGYA